MNWKFIEKIHNPINWLFWSRCKVWSIIWWFIKFWIMNNSVAYLGKTPLYTMFSSIKFVFLGYQTVVRFWKFRKALLQRVLTVKCGIFAHWTTPLRQNKPISLQGFHNWGRNIQKFYINWPLLGSSETQS